MGEEIDFCEGDAKTKRREEKTTLEKERLGAINHQRLSFYKVLA
jgi:hypothetical protein